MTLDVRYTLRFNINSPLHIGALEEFTGVSGESVKLKQSLSGDKELLIIPGTTLRGLFRAWACKDFVELLFDNPMPEDGNQSLISGDAEVWFDYAEVLQGGGGRSETRSSHKRNPRTMTTEKHGLAARSYIPKGSYFNAEIRLKRANETIIKDFEALIQALFRASPNLQIGSQKMLGHGELDLRYAKKKIATLESARGSLATIREPWTTAPSLKFETTQKLGCTLQGFIEIPLVMKPNGYWFSSDKDASLKPAQDKKPRNNINKLFRTKGGTPSIKASSFKGWMRNRCRMILLTLSPDPNRAELLLGQIFGDENQRARLRFCDLEAVSNDTYTVAQVAIDRYSGAPSHGKLFETEVSHSELNSTLWVSNQLDDHQKMLIALALQDLMLGDCTLGGRDAIGWGQFTAQVAGCTDTSELASLFNLPDGFQLNSEELCSANYPEDGHPDE